ncbi:MAG: hypothetical protein ACLT98_04425 [Eggerthellaceae bacterium]
MAYLPEARRPRGSNLKRSIQADRRRIDVLGGSGGWFLVLRRWLKTRFAS